MEKHRDTGDGSAPRGELDENVAAILYGFNGVTFDRLRGGVIAVQTHPVVAVLGLDTRSFNYVFDNSQFILQKCQSASVVSQTQQDGITAVALAGNWSAQADPAAAAQATITRAAGAAGVRHICTSIHASLSGGAAASGVMKVYLRDGAAGVGAILWSGNLQAGALGHAHVELSALSIVGSVATAMTLEFAAAAGAGSQENVTLTGYDVA